MVAVAVYGFWGFCLVCFAAYIYIYIDYSCHFFSLCIFPQGVNAAFDVLVICNVNVYELSQRLLLRKNPLDVSYRLYTLPLCSVINY